MPVEFKVKLPRLLLAVALPITPLILLEADVVLIVRFSPPVTPSPTILWNCNCAPLNVVFVPRVTVPLYV